MRFLFRRAHNLSIIYLKNTAKKVDNFAAILYIIIVANRFPNFGVWRSLVAHMVWDHGVGSSNLLTPTTHHDSDAGHFPDKGL